MLNQSSQSAELHAGLVVDTRDLVIEKPRFGAFYGTDLDVILQERGIESIIISGISSDICCDTTAREANARDLPVFFLSDGTATAGPNPTEVQMRTLNLMGALFAQVLTIDEMVHKITGSADGDGAP